MKIVRLMQVILLLTVSAVTINAQEASDIVQWTAKITPAHALKAGQKVTAIVDAQIEDGWHVYSISQPPGGPVATVISVPAKQVIRLDGKVIGPMPETTYDPNFEMQTEFYEGSASFKVPLIIASSTKPGPAKGDIDVLFQACNDRFCLPPTTVHVALPLKTFWTSPRTNHLSSILMQPRRGSHR